jgi:N-acyl-D-aspartate/D-glutamate deacylase
VIDTIIRGGEIVDGTGGAARFADVAIQDGLISDIGVVREEASRTIDASGLVVCPGFVDLHTHYDAQILWDPTVSPSPLHGFTTIIGGNCGFTIAPIDDSDAEYVRDMLATVEGIPVDALKSGIDWNWSSFGQWLDRLEGNLAVNAGFLVGHSTLRRTVMGMRYAAPANDEQLGRLEVALEDCLRSGALGFSSSHAQTHRDADDLPVPSRYSTSDELIRLSETVGRFPGTQLEFIPTAEYFSVENVELMVDMSVAADRPVNWNTLRVDSTDRAGIDHQLAASDAASEVGACIAALAYPDVTDLFLTFAGTTFTFIPGWSDVVALPYAQKLIALQDPSVRDQLKKGARSMTPDMRFSHLPRFAEYVIVKPSTNMHSELIGLSVSEIASRQGRSKDDPLDVLLDLVIEAGLGTLLKGPLIGDDDATWSTRAAVLRDDRVVIGASDAGAHIDVMCSAGYSTSILNNIVRKRRLMDLEEAIHRITDRPARFYGLRGRGRLAPGYYADVVLFDPETVAGNALEVRADFPGGASRHYRDATGVNRVLVNGVDVVVDGHFTNARPGRLLRSGRDTATVTAGVGRQILRTRSGGSGIEHNA